MASEKKQNTADHKEFIPPMRTFVLVWIALLCLTVLTVWVSRIDLGRWKEVAALSTIIAVGIASVKSSLVLFFFMGLKYEQPVFRWMFFVTACALAVFIVLTYADVLYR